MAGTRIEVVHVGSASRDLTPDDPRGWRLGGGASYAALTTARLGLRTAALIGVDAAAATAGELDRLRDAGVDVHLVHLAEGPVFDNRETAEGRIQISQAVGRPIAVPMIPAAWLRAIAWSIVPVAGEIGDAWAAVVPDGAYLSLGWQGMLRDLVVDGQVERRAPVESALLRRADLVGVSHHDLTPGTDLAAVSRYLHPGADLAVTEGPAGGMLIRVGEGGPREIRRYPATASAGETDPTGAGDVFLAALLATVIHPFRAGPATSLDGPDLAFAAAAGSLAVEGIGLAGVPDLGAVLARLNEEASRLPHGGSQEGWDPRRTP